MSSKVTLLTLFLSLSLGSCWGALDSSKYEEKGCAASVAAADLKQDFVSKTAAWYVPMASTFVYHTWVERFTNKSATPADLTNLCLKFLFMASAKSNTYMIAAGGLKKVLTYECTSPTLQSQKCNGIPGTPDFVAGMESDEVIVKTDNANYLLMVQCIKNTLKGWYVMTPTDAAPSDAVKKDVLTAVLALGFKKELASMISYAACPKATPK